MFGFSRDFLVILLHKLISILSSSGSTLHAWIREGVRTLSPGEFKFLKFTRNVFQTFLLFSGKTYIACGEQGNVGFRASPRENSNLLGLHSKITEKNQGPLTYEFLSTKRAKYSFHFLTCLKTKLHVHVTIEGILSIINFLYECQCKCGCMEKVATCRFTIHFDIYFGINSTCYLSL